MSDNMEALAVQFTTHKQRKGGGGMALTYVSIDQMLDRANEVYGDTWSSELLDFKYEGGVCTIALSLTVPTDTTNLTTSTRFGVGASNMKDPDDCLKTALAEALKKAWNQFGMGLYLWKEEHLDAIAKSEFRGEATLAEKKAILVKAAREAGIEITTDNVAAYYKVDTPEDFDDEALVDVLIADLGLESL